MSWTAFDRAIRLATGHARPGDLGKWTSARDAIYDQVWDKGWSNERGAFVQHYGDKVLDSSLLRMGTVGFITPHRWARRFANRSALSEDSSSPAVAAVKITPVWIAS